MAAKWSGRTRTVTSASVLIGFVPVYALVI